MTAVSDTPLVVTMGSGGSLGFVRGEIYEQPALPAERVVDPTGCGDCFLAAFVLSWHRRADITEALRAGALEAARTIARLGAA
jgi:sugar/nucleoside kinase (ribokinase family)